jgi:hypothetical protein
MITEVYFIEGLYLYTEVGSSGRAVLTSREQCSQVQLIAPGRVERTLQTGCVNERLIGGGYSRGISR